MGTVIAASSGNCQVSLQYPNGQEALHDYIELFVQRHPRYGLKKRGRSWITIHGSLHDERIKRHLKGDLAVAVIAKWYPGYVLLDFDEMPLVLVERIRGRLGLNEQNSMLCTSESVDSYHLIFRPLYKGKPCTIRLLNLILENIAHELHFEIYPQPLKPVRLPFSVIQKNVDYEYANLNSLEQKLWWFFKLDEVELSEMPRAQLVLEMTIDNRADTFMETLDDSLLKVSPNTALLTTFKIGKEYLQTGLVMSSSRHYAQFCVLYYLWRVNTDIQNAIEIAWHWVCTKHNGFSKDIERHPHIVFREIQRQADKIWTEYEMSDRLLLPDKVHNAFKGYITKPDLEEIIMITRGSLPKSRFLFNLIKFWNPRHHRDSITVHSDKLIDWSSRKTYLKYLQELEQKEIVKRGKSYQTDVRSKSLSINWKFRTDSEAVLYEGRSISSLEGSIQLIYRDHEEFRGLLRQAGIDRRTIPSYLRTIYMSGKV